MLRKMIEENFEKNLVNMCGNDDEANDKFNKHTTELLEQSLQSFEKRAKSLLTDQADWNQSLEHYIFELEEKFKARIKEKRDQEIKKLMKMYGEEARDVIKKVVSEGLTDLDADFWQKVQAELGKEVRVFMDEINDIMTNGFKTT